MGGDGYALLRAVSDTLLAQLRSRENLARSDLPRRSPSDIFKESRQCIEDCMKVVGCFGGRYRLLISYHNLFLLIADAPRLIDLMRRAWKGNLETKWSCRTQDSRRRCRMRRFWESAMYEAEGVCQGFILVSR